MIGTLPGHGNNAGNVLEAEQSSPDFSMARFYVSTPMIYWSVLGNGMIGNMKLRLALG